MEGLERKAEFWDRKAEEREKPGERSESYRGYEKKNRDYSLLIEQEGLDTYLETLKMEARKN